MQADLTPEALKGFNYVIQMLLLSNAAAIVGWIFREIRTRNRVHKSLDIAHQKIRELELKFNTLVKEKNHESTCSSLQK